MESSDKLVLVHGRVPKKCPFCWSSDGVAWTEFIVSFADVHYVDTGSPVPQIGNLKDTEVRVYCTRCNEDIRSEDLN